MRPQHDRTCVKRKISPTEKTGAGQKCQRAAPTLFFGAWQSPASWPDPVRKAFTLQRPMDLRGELFVVRPSGLPWKRNGRGNRRKALSREDSGQPFAFLSQTAEAVTTNSSVPTPKPGTRLPSPDFVSGLCSLDFVHPPPGQRGGTKGRDKGGGAV